jgi:hypothetical protein
MNKILGDRYVKPENLTPLMTFPDGCGGGLKFSRL